MARKRQVAKRRRANLDREAWALFMDDPAAETERATDAGLDPWRIFWYTFHPEQRSAGNVPTLRALWDENRDTVLAEWIRAHPGTRPSYWWRWEAPEARPEGEEEAVYLDRHGLMTADERDALGWQVA